MDELPPLGEVLRQGQQRFVPQQPYSLNTPSILPNSQTDLTLSRDVCAPRDVQIISLTEETSEYLRYIDPKVRPVELTMFNINLFEHDEFKSHIQETIKPWSLAFAREYPKIEQCFMYLEQYTSIQLHSVWMDKGHFSNYQPPKVAMDEFFRKDIPQVLFKRFFKRIFTDTPPSISYDPTFETMNADLYTICERAKWFNTY